VAESPEGDSYLVGILHDEPWEEGGMHLVPLQARINDCLAFITGGQMDEMYPASVGKPKRVQVFYAEPPDAMTAEFFSRVSVTLAAEGIEFATERLTD
jgi:hypothetical protein